MVNGCYRSRPLLWRPLEKPVDYRPDHACLPEYRGTTRLRGKSRLDLLLRRYGLYAALLETARIAERRGSRDAPTEDRMFSLRGQLGGPEKTRRRLL